MHPVANRLKRGFTLIEQATVVAALGVLSATALPYMAELKLGAEAVALQSLASAAGTAMLINQGTCVLAANPPGGVPLSPALCVAIRDCADTPALLAADLPADVQLLPKALSATPGGVQQCELAHLPSGTRAVFRGQGTAG